MTKTRRIVTSTLLSLFIMTSVGCASPEEKAASLLTEAAKLVNEGEKASSESFITAYAAYQAAQVKLDRIRNDFGQTKAATDLDNGSAMFGPFSGTDFSRVVVPQAKLKAEAESSPIVCAEYLARSASDPFTRGLGLIQVGLQLAEMGDTERIGDLSRDIETIARQGAGMPGHDDPAGLYRSIASLYAHAGMIKEAVTVTQAHGLMDQYEYALAYAKAGDITQVRQAVSSFSAYDHSKAMAILAQTLTEQNRPDEAQAAAEETERVFGWVPTDWQPFSIHQVAAGIVQAGEIKRALAWIEESQFLRFTGQESIDRLLKRLQPADKQELLALLKRQEPTILRDLAIKRQEQALWLANAAYIEARLGDSQAALFTRVTHDSLRRSWRAGLREWT